MSVCLLSAVGALAPLMSEKPNFYLELNSLIYLLKLFCQQSNAVLIITMNLSLSRAMLGLGFVDRDRR